MKFELIILKAQVDKTLAYMSEADSIAATISIRNGVPFTS
ncbi:Hypothetical Protein U712_12665 [Bacillus subtilis PY79]|nr:Hypothetical Protein U712_12665 [Bacillus subtilis PY79]AKN14604.1 hypothetical protein ABU16_3528 [Bacillus subtilis]EHA31220.1 hypothetical protein BSSC8_16630 [Bacillus subtilis subsp. subtilis str. SC-8]EME06527.1 hypothetical protein BS732_3115 [Bacillus subtilis MB73/2]KZD84764.1 hypothetical protein B4417_0839 [Bacillus subtilis]